MKDENGLPRNRSGTVSAESNNHKTIVFCRIAYVCFGIQIGLGITALAGWACNFKLLACFRSDYIPMAQSTAITFTVFGTSAVFLVFWHKYRPFKLFALLTAVFTILISLFMLFRFSTGNIFCYECLVFGKKDLLGMVPTGVMSPVTASAFLLGGVSYLFTLFSVHRRHIKTASSILSAIVMIIGFVVILGYLYGTPLLYGGTTVPMALTTASAFVFLGTGLMVSIGAQYWPFYLVVAPTTCIRIIRSFMPIIIVIVLVNGWLVANVNRVFPVNPAFTSALLCIVFLALSSYSISKIARRLGNKIDRAEDNYKRVSFAVEQSPVSIIITDSRGNIEYVNPKFRQLTGYTTEEVIGKNLRILKSGETTSEEYKRLWDTITSGNDWSGRFHNKKKNGELYWEDALISPVKNNDGKIINFIAIKEDITREAEIGQRNQAQYAIAAILVQATSAEEIVSKVIQTICECFGWDFGTLWVVDRQENVLRSKINWQGPLLDLSAFESATQKITFKSGIGLPGRVWANGKPLWIMDFVEDKYFPRFKYALKDGLHGACGFPIVYENNVIGVMDFFSRSIRPFDNDMLDMMDALGHQIGMFLARQQMYEQMEKQLNHISVLMEIDRAIASSLDLEVIGGIFAEKVIKHLQADAIDILLYNQYAQKFSFMYGSGFLKQKEKQLVLNSSTDLCGKMLLKDEPVFISNLRDEGIICTRSQLAQEEGFVSYYGIPITAKGRLIGVVEFFSGGNSSQNQHGLILQSPFLCNWLLP